MGMHLRLEVLNELLATGTDFPFTGKEYRELTNADLP